jgi:hypothetical protein
MSDTDLVAVATATALTHQRVELPCPVCGNVMKGSSLPKHLTSKHQTSTLVVPVLRGRDRRIRAWFAVPFLVAVAVFFPTVNRTAGKVMIAVAALAAGCALVAISRGFPSSVVVRENALVLTHSLGLRRRRIGFPAGWTRGETWWGGDPTGTNYGSRRTGSWVAVGTRFHRIVIGYGSDGRLPSGGGAPLRRLKGGTVKARRMWHDSDCLLGSLEFVQLWWLLLDRGVFELAG